MYKSRGVVQDHMHYKVLTKILNVVVLPVESNRTYNNSYIVITDDHCYYVKVMTAITITLITPYWQHFSNHGSHHYKQQTKMCQAPSSTFCIETSQLT